MGCLVADRHRGAGRAVPGVASPFGAAGAHRRRDRPLDAINDRGSTRDVYRQNSRNYAFFTHNIFHITDRLDLTLGAALHQRAQALRTRRSPTTTPAASRNQTALTPFLTTPGLAPVAQGIVGLSCQGNSTSELNGVSIRDQRNEDEFTGTAVLSYKPVDALLLYASYSRGYKAGGFNLDRSALKKPIARRSR